jgi:hypothetical protein
LDLPDVPDVSRETRRRCSAACHRASILSAHQDGPTAAVPCGRRPQGSDTQTDQAAAGVAAAFRCSVHRPRMRGCFTWNRRQCPGGRRPSEPDAGPGCLMKEPVRCSTALVLGDSDAHRPQDPRGIGPVLHSECRADPGARTGPMFHVEPEAVSGGRDGSLSFERPDRMSHEGLRPSSRR